MRNISVYNLDNEPIKYYYQWDSNQKIVLQDIVADTETYVHFCHIDSNKALVVKPEVDGDRLIANVPNLLLQSAKRLLIYVYQTDQITGNSTMYAASIIVIPRPQPEDYCYVETETGGYKSLDQRIKSLEAEHRILTFTVGNEPVIPEKGDYFIGVSPQDAFSDIPQIGDWVICQDAIFKITNIDTSTAKTKYWYSFLIDLSHVGSVKTVNGKKPDESGNVDTSYIIRIYYDGDSDTYQFVEEFDWNALEEKVTAGVPVFLHVYDSTPDPDISVSSLLLDVCDREDGIAEFRQTYYDGRLRTRKYTIYGDGTIEREITNVPMDNTVIVTVDGSKASHTAKQIQNSMTDGASVILLYDDKYFTLSHYDGSAYFIEANDGGVPLIHCVYDDGGYETFEFEVVTIDDLNDAMSKTVKSVNGVTPDKNGNVDISMLPASTDADEGKVLRLVNGVPTWSTLINAEEVAF